MGEIQNWRTAQIPPTLHQLSAQNHGSFPPKEFFCSRPENCRAPRFKPLRHRGLLDFRLHQPWRLSTDWRGSPQPAQLSPKSASLYSGFPWVRFSASSTKKAELVRRLRLSTWPPASLSRDSRFSWWTAIPRQTAPRVSVFSATTTAAPCTTC